MMINNNIRYTENELLKLRGAVASGYINKCIKHNNEAVFTHDNITLPVLFEPLCLVIANNVEASFIERYGLIEGINMACKALYDMIDHDISYPIANGKISPDLIRLSSLGTFLLDEFFTGFIEHIKEHGLPEPVRH